MRFLHLAPYYPSHIEQFYARHPQLVDQPYAQQHDALLSDGFHWGMFLHQELRHYEYDTRHYIINAKLMQQQWARENNISYGDAWESEIALAQVKAFQPDILYTNLSPEFIKEARRTAPSIRCVIGWAGEPIVDAERFQAHDLVLTCVKELVSFYRDAGLQSDLLHHAFYPPILDQMSTGDDASQSQSVDVGFIGSMVYGQHAHLQRAELFARLLDEINIALYGNINTIEITQDTDTSLRGQVRRHYFATLAQLHRAGFGAIVKLLPRGSFVLRQERDRRYQPIFDTLAQVANPPVFGIAMYELLTDFKICLNAHAWSDYASNMRLYETTGVGTCLLTDWKQDLHEQFEPDVDVVTYKNMDEAIEKIRYLLDHDDERQAIARAGQRRTLRDHTLAIRTEKFDHILRTHI